MSEPYIKDGALYQGGRMFASAIGTENLRRFFLAERDKELGRWRWPENPDLLVYKDFDKTGKDTGMVRVTSEATGFGIGPFSRSVAKTGVYGEAARAYFAAHPEPKPWHAAKHNEVWVLFVAICEEAYRVDGNVFVPVNSPERIRIPLDDSRIRAARRIWPEGD